MAYYVTYMFPDGLSLHSDYMDTEQEAYDFLESLRSSDNNYKITYQIYQQTNNNSLVEELYNNCKKLSDEVSDDTDYQVSEENMIHPKFTGMTYTPYGKGYLMTPPDGHQDTGTKYYHNGWWMPSQDAWFFKANLLQSLIDNGATPYIEIKDLNKTLPFTGMTFEPYGKGYLLTCPENHSDYGLKYYHNGWWMPKHDAWFFKKEYLDYLIDNGATDGNESSGEDNELFSNMTFESYGKGYLLSCSENHSDYGTKYFYNGWWMPKHNSWFFKSSYKEFLQDNGAFEIIN